MQGLHPELSRILAQIADRSRSGFASKWWRSFSGEPFRAMEEQARRNVAMFQQAVQMFNPFAMPPATNPVDAATPAAAAGTGRGEPAASPEDIRPSRKS